MSFSFLHPESADGAALTEREMKVFVDVTLRYFEKVAQGPAEITDPAIYIGTPPILDFVGAIKISGSCSGFIYVTMERAMLVNLLLSLGEAPQSDEDCCDYIGEIANTVSSNARELFGSAFRVSVPAPLMGDAARGMPFAKTSFAVPLTWHGSQGFIVISLRQN